jgi:hypothetical protein
MSQQAPVEFVCYESGFVNVKQMLDNLLPPTLQRTQPGPHWYDQEPSIEQPSEAVERPFRPSFRTLRLHHAPEEILPRLESRLRLFERKAKEVEKEEPVFKPQKIASTTVALLTSPTSTPERVFPFRKAIESEASTSDQLPALIERTRPSPPLQPIEPPQKRIDPLPALVERPRPIRKPEAPPAFRDLFPQALERPRPVARPTPIPLSGNVAHRSFHDLLAARSTTTQEDDRRRAPVEKLSRNWLATVIWIIGESMIFAGAGGVGAGIMALCRGESFAKWPGLAIVGGVAVVAMIILLRKVAKLGLKPMPSAARA